MADFINTNAVIGDDELIDSILMRTITEYKDNVVTCIRGWAFGECTELTLVDVPNVVTIDTGACYGCTVLNTFILRGETVCTLSATDAFSNTPIASGTGYIYVPSALLADYQAATNWSNYAAQFRALEDYTVDGTVDGELDETKIAA